MYIPLDAYITKTASYAKENKAQHSNTCNLQEEANTVIIRLKPQKIQTCFSKKIKDDIRRLGETIAMEVNRMINLLAKVTSASE